jgi:anthranilate phosphoribosyltransferase
MLETAETLKGNMPFLDHFHKICHRKALTRDEAREAMNEILRGEVSTALIAAFLAAWKVLGDGVDELTGFTEAMRENMTPVLAPEGVQVLDTCGTGGDGLSTFNISTVTALVIAGAGVTVAKHGNRSVSSHTGSADILERLGVNVDLNAAQMGVCLREAGIAFLYAPVVHPAMKYAAEARRELKMRTVFNLLGPLANPAGARHQLIGAATFEAARYMAQVLATLGTGVAYVVHGEDGLDEVTTTGRTMVYEVRGESITKRALKVEDFGVPAGSLEELHAEGPEDSVRAAREILDCVPSAKLDIVLVNASVGLVAAGAAADFKQGVGMAWDSISSGKAKETLERLVRVSNGV